MVASAALSGSGLGLGLGLAEAVTVTIVGEDESAGSEPLQATIDMATTTGVTQD